SLLLREVEQAVGVEGVSGLDAVEPELQPLFGAEPGHPRDHLFGLLDGRLVLPGEPLRVLDRGIEARRRRRIELERAPDHDGVFAGLAERRLEAVFADPTPGTGDVGPDVDSE